MTKERLSKLWYMIEKELGRMGLIDMLEIWDITIEEWNWLKDKIQDIPLDNQD